MQILIMPKPLALFGLRFLMIFAKSSLVNEIVERRLSVLLKESVGRLLVFSTSMHYFFFFFFLLGFLFTDIHESQDCRERGRAFL